MKIQLFEATKNAVVVTDNKQVVVIRGGLTPKQAERMAARLNNEAQDKEIKPMHREVTYRATIKGEIDIVVNTEWEDNLRTISQVKREIESSLQEMYVGGADSISDEFTVTVKKISDKKVENE